MCVLRGGSRFYGTTYQVGRSEWLRLQTQNVAPPLFSASGNAEEAWVRNDQQAICQVGRGFKQAPTYLPQVPPSRPSLATRDSLAAANKSSCTSSRKSSSVALSRFTPSEHSFGERSSRVPPASVGPVSEEVTQECVPPSMTEEEHSLSERSGRFLPPSAVPVSEEVTQVRASLSRTKEEWARQPMGAWCNFRRYGVQGGPANVNCGRWRQFPD
mmetsp:Transcript_93977/g.293721  ORF Transcript_93977/g.293721 Transcript_93977/m.293721 type:complete len:214 (-) Transcript_93977:98-739(-)